MNRPSIDVVAHEDLDWSDFGELRRLFDGEYLGDLGEWEPHQPYGYASHDVHTIARVNGPVVGHVG